MRPPCSFEPPSSSSHSCDGSYGSTEECLETCRAMPEGEWGDGSGDTAQCRLTYGLNATLTAEDNQRQVLCGLAAGDSFVCRDATLEALREEHGGHGRAHGEGHGKAHTAEVLKDRRHRGRVGDRKAEECEP